MRANITIICYYYQIKMTNKVTLILIKIKLIVVQLGVIHLMSIKGQLLMKLYDFRHFK